MAFKTGTEIKVGVFVFLALVGLAFMSLQVGTGALLSRGTYELVVYFDNVTGLKADSPVEVAGIEVGRVRAITLEEGRARLALEIAGPVKIPADTVASIKSRGVLGDKYVDLSGGSPDSPDLADGGVLARSDRSADLEVLFQKVGQIADDIGVVAKSVSNVFGGPQGEQNLRLTFDSLRDLTVSLNQMVQQNVESVNLIVENLREFSGDLRHMSGANRDGIDNIVANFETASAQMSQTLERVNSVMAKIDAGQGAVGRMVNDEELGADLRQAVASLESVATKIDEGKGSLGRLINDDTTSKELDKALEGINKYLEKQDTFRTTLDFRSEVLADSGNVKSYLDLTLQPSEDHYYILGVVSDPEGRTRETETVTQTWVGGSYSERREIEEKTERDKITFNAQIAKRWHNVALRGGLFESTGGVGADVYLWDDRVRLYAEAFDFDKDDPPHLKAGGRLYFLKNFYLTAGVDNFASDASFFGGVGLSFTDDDLKYIMTSAPIPSN